MNLLTKEECEKALDCLSDDDKMDELAQNFSMDDDYVSHANYEIARKWCYDQLKECIDEHFDNPPLKFEELIKHKVVWDNELKEYAFVLEQYKPTILNVPAPSDLQAISLEYRGGEIECLLSVKVEETINDYYQPNRFYRKEVQK